MKNKKLLILIFLSLVLQNCGVYSFTGTSLSEDLESISIQNFGMTTAGGPQNMTLDFNEELKEYYQRNTNLKLIPVEGDLSLSGSIVAYEMTPIATTAGDRAAANRLTITIEVIFQNTLNEEDDFERDFSFYMDFPQQQTLSDVEPNMVPKILEQLVLDIFNATAAQW